MTDNLGALAAALAKAQASFPAITRDKEVTVTSKRTNSTYKFKYAPLDSIIEKTRKPLADNGLAVAQLLDSDADGAPALVTMLLHAEGGSLTARTPIPQTDGGTVQDFGSAITYLRRYALQALLGIAAEEDDDGNSASGNQATFRSERNPRAAAPENQPDTNGGLIGTATKQAVKTTDFLVRETSDGAFLGFRLKDGAGAGVICEVRGPLAVLVAAHEEEILGQRVQVWGSFVSYAPPVVAHPYRAYRIDRITAGGITLPVEASEPDTVPLFPDDVEAELDAAATAA